MFILKKWELDCEGYFNIETALCVSESKELLKQYQEKNEEYLLIDEGQYIENYCKANGIKLYSVNAYCTIGEIELLQ